MESCIHFLEENNQRFVDELIQMLKIPSISADTAYHEDVISCADMVAERLKEAGADMVEVIETEGYPVVYGQKIKDPQLPTILVYGHYDVQPPDPMDLWQSGPFEPVIKKTDIHPEGAIFARGSADDKGQFYMHVKAFEGMQKTGSLPCNVKFLIEGEEEVGSPSLEKFLADNTEKLKNDIILISDTEMISMENPSIAVGLRGMSYVEVEVKGSDKDMHSGVYGGAVPNPLNILSKMIADLHDENGKINIPGFYENVVDLSEEEREKIANIPFDLEEYKSSIDIKDIHGEEGYSTIERASTRPTLDANGIWGGYIGEGAKTVIPSKAFAKISMRLVPNQDPDRITKLFIEHFKSIAPPSVEVNCTPHHGGLPYLLPTDDKGFKAAEKAIEKTFGKTPIPARGGGSIPIVALFEKVLGSKSVLLGFGLNSDVIHSPNENFGLYNFRKGIETIPYFFKYYANPSQD